MRVRNFRLSLPTTYQWCVLSTMSVLLSCVCDVDLNGFLNMFPQHFYIWKAAARTQTRRISLTLSPIDDSPGAAGIVTYRCDCSVEIISFVNIMARPLFRNKWLKVSSFAFVTFIVGYLMWWELWIQFSYFTRPWWGKPPIVPNIITHYYAEGVPYETLCARHGWEYRDRNTTVRVIDAIIFSTELDLLEIRIRELLPVVDKFFIVESTTTFMGQPKQAVFGENRKRFAFAGDKIVYELMRGEPLPPGKSPWHNEIMLRSFMTGLLMRNGVDRGDMVIMSDCDEIPRYDVKLN